MASRRRGLSEQLPREYFDKLVDKIWFLSKSSMHHLIVRAPKPAQITTCIFENGTVVEPYIYIENELPAALEKTPSSLALRISSSESFQPDVDYGDDCNDLFMMYSFRLLELEPDDIKFTYSTGISIEDEDHGIITPQFGGSAVPLRGKNKQDRQWKELMGGNMANFDTNEADFFLRTIDKFILKVLDEKLTGHSDD